MLEHFPGYRCSCFKGLGSLCLRKSNKKINEINMINKKVSSFISSKIVKTFVFFF